MPHKLDYTTWLHLDAEDLAESGVAKAYAALCSQLNNYVPEPARIEESIDDEQPSYVVRCGAQEFIIYGPSFGNDGAAAWGRATVALFAIVNTQLANAPVRFYAINSGNDLGGMFLTPAQAHAAREALPNAQDWPSLHASNRPGTGNIMRRRREAAEQAAAADERRSPVRRGRYTSGAARG